MNFMVCYLADDVVRVIPINVQLQLLGDMQVTARKPSQVLYVNVECV